MKRIYLYIIIISAVFISSVFLFLSRLNPKIILNPVVNSNVIKIKKPLEKYSFTELKNRNSQAGSISIGNNMKNGDGTRRDGEIFAVNGFITLAPDFLGYGESASPSANPIEERFQTYTTVLDLLASVKSINQALSNLDNNIAADVQKVGIWGHSNGGQIALSVLAITGANYPTVLWAPVSKPFPYSVLYYTDEFDDHGKKLRKVIADFERDYDSDFYTYTNYMDWISAPIELHQGKEDEEVPQKWSDQLVKDLKNKGKDIIYFTYPVEDHNFTKGDWMQIIQRNIAFYRKQFSNNTKKITNL